MSSSSDALFAALWTDYRALAPHAERIHALLGRDRAVPNDHVAFRGIGRPGVGIDALAEAFRLLGYEPRGEYVFEEKKLFARHFESREQKQPKVFISELLVEKLSPRSQRILEGLLAQIPLGISGGYGGSSGAREASEPTDALTLKRPLVLAGRPWSLTQAEYYELLEESEYAAWVAAFGFRVNHFTVAVHELGSFPSLQALNDLLEAEGFELNAAGGKIKGRPEIGLQQSSTLAPPVRVEFSDGPLEIPGVYYEFAWRHSVDGVLYSGFVTSSADRIFESTDARGRG